jgi:pimeloyl-ACP methyl ester carboxylesterase
MDQRNARFSKGPLGDGWSTYTEDQLALLDHLGVDRCLAMGSCIGPSYIFHLMKTAPERIVAPVLMQPIGLAEHTTEPESWPETNLPQTQGWWNMWAANLVNTSRAEKGTLRQLQVAMFEQDDSKDFVFSVSRDFVKSLTTPLLVLMGVDFYHPTATSREIADLAPNAELIENWKRGSHETETAGNRVIKFLESHGQKAGLPSVMAPKGTPKL